MRALERTTWGSIALVALLAFAFQGSRGLWEPDEGFYGTGAAGMLADGSLLVPQVAGKPFLDKPPLVYWAGVAGMELVGRNEWGLRLAHALAFLLTALAVGGLARALWDPPTGALALLAYGTMLAPFLAANVFTPDTLLAAAVPAMVLGYVRAELALERARRLGWWLFAGIAAGLGLLAKGPALLVFTPPLLVHLAVRRRLPAALAEPGPWIGALVALGIGLPWYLKVGAALPGAAEYLLDNQVFGRLVDETYGRNAGTLGGVKVYLPTVLLGSLPWGPWALARAIRRWRNGRAAARTHDLDRVPRESAAFRPELLIALWIALPLLVLVFAKSRLPLYALPAFGALALASARGLAPSPGSTSGGGIEPFAGRGSAAIWALAAWSLLLLALKATAAYWAVFPQDSRAFLATLRAGAREPYCEVVAVDLKRNAFGFYGVAGFEWARGFSPVYPFFSPLESFAEEAREAAGCSQPHAFLVPRSRLEAARGVLAEAGLACEERPGNREDAVLACRALAPEPPTSPLPPASPAPPEVDLAPHATVR